MQHSLQFFVKGKALQSLILNMFICAPGRASLMSVNCCSNLQKMEEKSVFIICVRDAGHTAQTAPQKIN